MIIPRHHYRRTFLLFATTFRHHVDVQNAAEEVLIIAITETAMAEYCASHVETPKPNLLS